MMRLFSISLIYAEALIRDKSVWATIIADIPEGYVCAWTVTDPEDKPGKKAKKKLVTPLRRK